MALAIAQTLAFQVSGYLGTNPLVSASVSLPADSLVIVTTGSVAYLDTYHTANTPTNTGTALTWALVNTNENDDGSGYTQSQIWYAKNTTAQTITISVYYNTTSGYDVHRVLSGYVITGHNTTTPIGNITAASLVLNVSTSNALALLAITDESGTATTSSNMVETTVTGSGAYNSFLAYQPVASPGNFTAVVAGTFTIPAYVMGEVKAAGGTAYTAAASATATATGTAAMSSARTLQASATSTATGTAAASNQRTLTASATGTASGTAAMSSTQAMSVNATITATGTADASITPIVAIAASATITATGTSTASNQKTLAASATATATASASMLSIISVAAAGTATASATATALITTPGSLYGNATKVAGLYGSSTKPTLTTRS